MDKRQQMWEFLMAIRDGAFVEELYDGCQLANDTVQQLGKVATVQATITQAYLNDALVVTGESQVKLPVVKKKAQIFFPRIGQLPSRKNEAQQEMFAPKIVTADEEAS